MIRAKTEQLNHIPWFAKAGAASSIVPISRFVGPSIFSLKSGGYARAQLRALHRLQPLIPRWNRIAKHLLDRLARNPELPRYLTLAPSLHQHRTPHTPIKLHSEHPSGVP
jgi:hypothetical protein